MTYLLLLFSEYEYIVAYDDNIKENGCLIKISVNIFALNGYQTIWRYRI